MIGLTAFSGCATKQVIIHDDLVLPNSCPYSPLTPDQIEFLQETNIGDSIGRNIRKNRVNCELRQERLKYILSAHNQAYKKRG